MERRNGPATWPRRGAATVTLARHGAAYPSVPTDCRTGTSVTASILATAAQQPFPGNLVYRAARRHILATGIYFRLDPEG